jgi:hypothetical protein
MLALERAARETPSACPARLREGPYDVISGTELSDVRTNGCHDPCDLVTQHRGCRKDVVSSEQKIGVTQADRLHVNKSFAPDRRGDVHILEVEPTTQCVKYQRLYVPNFPRGSLIRPRHLFYQTDCGKVSEWNFGI